MKTLLYIDPNDNRYWVNEENHVLHREDGPAIELVNGDRIWYENGHLSALSYDGDPRQPVKFSYVKYQIYFNKNGVYVGKKR